jgi:predicted 3-demethylubiquinone-9 3-methyltransferase (glyoxalase superfamily)
MRLVQGQMGLSWQITPRVLTDEMAKEPGLKPRGFSRQNLCFIRKFSGDL